MDCGGIAFKAHAASATVAGFWHVLVSVSAARLVPQLAYTLTPWQVPGAGGLHTARPGAAAPGTATLGRLGRARLRGRGAAPGRPSAARAGGGGGRVQLGRAAAAGAHRCRRHPSHHPGGPLGLSGQRQRQRCLSLDLEWAYMRACGSSPAMACARELAAMRGLAKVAAFAVDALLPTLPHFCWTSVRLSPPLPDRSPRLRCNRSRTACWTAARGCSCRPSASATASSCLHTARWPGASWQTDTSACLQTSEEQSHCMVPLEYLMSACSPQLSSQAVLTCVCRVPYPPPIHRPGPSWTLSARPSTALGYSSWGAGQCCR